MRTSLVYYCRNKSIKDQGNETELKGIFNMPIEGGIVLPTGAYITHIV